MADIYISGSELAELEINLGFGYLTNNIGVTEINENLIINPERNFGYYNKRFSAALNSGQITQAVYDAIINNQGPAKVFYELSTNINLDKQVLIDLATANNIPNVETSGTAAQILEDILNEGFQVIKKI